MGHWENSLQERGIPCSVGVQLNIKNPLLFIDLYCVNCLRRSPASSEPAMFGRETYKRWHILPFRAAHNILSTHFQCSTLRY